MLGFWLAASVSTEGFAIHRNCSHTDESLTDRNWLVIVAALLSQRDAESRSVARHALTIGRIGRVIKLARMIDRRHPTLTDMARFLHVSRRTTFRYLSTLQQCGFELDAVDGHSYRLRSADRLTARLLTRIRDLPV